MIHENEYPELPSYDEALRQAIGSPTIEHIDQLVQAELRLGALKKVQRERRKIDLIAQASEFERAADEAGYG